MSFEDIVNVCITLRNFESDSDYLDFKDFWIEKLSEDDRNQLCTDLKYFTNYPYDNHIAVRHYYIGRGKSSTVLRDNIFIFYYPLFRSMKLFSTGDLITPIAFYRWNGKLYEVLLQGENYGMGYGLTGNPYILNNDDIEAFNLFRIQIEKYLSFTQLHNIPYLKKPKILNNIDNRCLLALHLYLKRSVENNNNFMIFDKLIDYTIALESLYLGRWDEGKRGNLFQRIAALLCKTLYLERRNEGKRGNLSKRIAALLCKDESEKDKISRDIKKFYDIRSDLVHASLIDPKGNDFLYKNIYNYENILRKSILAFLDLNLSYKTKADVLSQLDQAASNPDLIKTIHESLEILKLAR